MFLSYEEIRKILSKAKYWNEVNNRDDISPLEQELSQEIKNLGTRILWILEDYAERNSPENAKHIEV